MSYSRLQVLYQSRIHPEQPAGSLNDTQLQSLHKSIVDVIGLAVSHDADSDQFPKSWLFHYRWSGKKKGTKDALGNP